MRYATVGYSYLEAVLELLPQGTVFAEVKGLTQEYPT